MQAKVKKYDKAVVIFKLNSRISHSGKASFWIPIATQYTYQYAKLILNRIASVSSSSLASQSLTSESNTKPAIEAAKDKTTIALCQFKKVSVCIKLYMPKLSIQISLRD